MQENKINFIEMMTLNYFLVQPGSRGWVNNERIVITSYYRQLSADIQMKNKKLKTSLVNIERAKALANITSINFLILILILKKKSCYMFIQYC